MMQQRVFFIRLYDDAVMALPAGKPASWYQIAIQAEYRLCTRKDYVKGLRRRKLHIGNVRLAA